MSIVTFEGVVEHGQIRLAPNIRLPDKTRVYVVVPGLEAEPARRLFSPRLAHPEQVSDFTMKVIQQEPDAGV